MEYIVGIIFIAVVAYLIRKDSKKKDLVIEEQKPVEAAKPKSIVGTWEGTLDAPRDANGQEYKWGGPNDEHDKAYTEAILKERPDWRGLGYCPSGEFKFTVNPDMTVSGQAWVNGYDQLIIGGPYVVGANAVTMPLSAHWICLEFNAESGTVGGLSWEGHDQLKRSLVNGRKVS